MAPWLLQSAEMLRETRVFASRDREVAQHEIARALNRHAMRWGRGEVDTALHMRRFDAVSAHLLRYGSAVEIEPDFPQSFYLLQMSVSGRARIHGRGRTLVLGAGSGAVISPDARVRLSWEAGCEQLLLKLPVERVSDVLRAMTGHHLGEPPEFDTGLGDAARPDAVWAPALLHALREASALGAAIGTLGGRSYARQLEELLLMRLLLSLPHSHAKMLREDHPQRAPRRIRQIRDYVAAHLSEPLTPLDLARAAGVSVRTLNAEFRAHCGTTPMTWLRGERLEAARRDLLAPAPGTRVAEVALRWGFMHLGRFSAMYRARYGESPRQTLER